MVHPTGILIHPMEVIPVVVLQTAVIQAVDLLMVVQMAVLQMAVIQAVDLQVEVHQMVDIPMEVHQMADLRMVGIPVVVLLMEDLLMVVIQAEDHQEGAVKTADQAKGVTEDLKMIILMVLIKAMDILVEDRKETEEVLLLKMATREADHKMAVDRDPIKCDLLLFSKVILLKLKEYNLCFISL